MLSRRRLVDVNKDRGLRFVISQGLSQLIGTYRISSYSVGIRTSWRKRHVITEYYHLTIGTYCNSTIGPHKIQTFSPSNDISYFNCRIRIFGCKEDCKTGKSTQNSCYMLSFLQKKVSLFDLIISVAHGNYNKFNRCFNIHIFGSDSTWEFQ